MFKNAIETTLETQCEPVFETKCDPVVKIAYEQQCKMITDKEFRDYQDIFCVHCYFVESKLTITGSKLTGQNSLLYPSRQSTFSFGIE